LILKRFQKGFIQNEDFQESQNHWNKVQFKK